MPELPEVETVKRGLEGLVGKKVEAVRFYREGLRCPFPQEIQQSLPGQTLQGLRRRSKYLLMDFEKGTLIVHLGMTGSIRIATPKEAPQKHDHMDLALGKQVMRLRDPRRFGIVAWQPKGESSPYLEKLGPEPLEEGFTGVTLKVALEGKSVPIKVAIMDPRVVVGAGNIYATEALHRAGIDPRKKAGSLTGKQCDALAGHIKDVLAEGIARGGSTLRDFHGVEGQTGTFATEHAAVYGRAGQPCKACQAEIKTVVLGGRASAYCPKCQKK